MSEVWETKEMVDICDLITCGVAKKPEYVDDGIPFLSAKNIKKGQVIWNNHKYISEKMHSELTKNNKPLKGDILYTRVGSFGEAAVVEEDVEFSVFVSLTLIKPKPTYVDKYFLKYFLNSDDVKKIAKNSISGSGVGNLNVGTVRKFRIPLPPLPQQKQIVAILDKAFAAIDTAKANAEQNLQNAKELFESYLQNVFENKNKDWEVKKLGEVAEVTYGFTDKSSEEGDYRYVRITDIDNNGELEKSNKKYLKSSEEGLKFLLKDNDIVMARTGATFAKLLLYKELEPSIFASYLIRIDFFEDIENEFYWYFSKSRGYWEQANNLSSGAAQPHFNGKALKEMIFSYPKSIKKQKILISEFKILQNETKKLETIYTQKIADLEEMKKSVLQKAFSGQLNTIN